eukprot:TRINITY_DN1063_c0_g1_i3.p1 TRINITY_DN1063_c0_g1~~TRINITY_DN1063_c0_g1_i3.p1  ORF type:complete len:677 (+),score=107.39 TRINITY_DN1063_c0_g1_i3:1417-3447(+)
MAHCRLTRNTAEAGGGLYLTTGPSVVYVGFTRFSDNTATRAGGAVYMEGSAGGGGLIDSNGVLRGIVRNCSFAGNSGAAGGAIYADSSLSIPVSNCTFERNVANGAGGALMEVTYSALSAAAATHNSFADNDALCCYAQDDLDSQSPGSTVTVTQGLTQPAGCMDVEAINRSRYCCVVGEYAQDGLCNACDQDKVNCSMLGITLETLPLLRGFWREGMDSDQASILTCWNPDACTGGAGMASLGSDSYCATGYTGPYCAACASGYVAGLGYKCVQCSSDDLALTVGLSAAAVAIVVILGVCLCCITHKAVTVTDVMDAPDRITTAVQAAARLLKAMQVLLQHLRVPLVASQLVTQFVAITGVRMPPLVEDMLYWLNAVNLDLQRVLPLSCLVPGWTFYDKLLVTTLIPLVIVLAVAATSACAQYFARKGKAGNNGAKETIVARAVHKVASRPLYIILALTFLIYSGVSSVIFQTFACDTLAGSGKSYLRADYSIQCTTATHTRFKIYAGFMIVLYPVGIPVLYAAVLWRHRRAIKAVETSSRASAKAVDARLASSSFLWEPYRPDRYYWEVVSCWRAAGCTPDFSACCLCAEGRDLKQVLSAESTAALGVQPQLVRPHRLKTVRCHTMTYRPDRPTPSVVILRNSIFSLSCCSVVQSSEFPATSDCVECFRTQNKK